MPSTPEAAADSCVSLAIETFPRPQSAEELYLDLMKRTLTRALIARPFERQTLRPSRPLLRRFFGFLKPRLAARNYELVRLLRSDPGQYVESGNETKTR